jgi:hypothetical protein
MTLTIHNAVIRVDNFLENMIYLTTISISDD